MKIRTQFVCQECGYACPKWVGKCPGCARWSTLAEERVGPAEVSAAPRFDSAPVRFDSLTEESVQRRPTGLGEFDRVLGGGVVDGALTLLGGDPGVGKSTLMLDVAARLSLFHPVLYASGEESPQQIKLRGDRMGIESGDLHVYSEMRVERILEVADQLGVRTVIVDSIQTTFSEKLEMPPGSIGQVREVASQFLVWTKTKLIPAFLIGHITKDGSLAGPKALEHIVDTVLYFEGPRQHPHRIVRTIKNRFGAANELGVFEMASDGLRPVENPSGLFLSHREELEAGSAVTCSVEGSRPFLIEIQALVSRTHFGTPRRLTKGVDTQRLALVAAVIEKRLGVNLWDQDIYLNVVGGLEIDEPAADLAVAASVLSSLLNRPLPPSTIVFGEVGLNGEVRPCLYPELRLKEAASLGFSGAILPAGTLAEDGLRIRRVGVASLGEAVTALFGEIDSGPQD